MFTFTDWLMMWAALLALGAGFDWLYAVHLRPALADIFGWEPWTQEDRIPSMFWFGALFFVSLLGFFAFAGAAVGL